MRLCHCLLGTPRVFCHHPVQEVPQQVSMTCLHSLPSPSAGCGPPEKAVAAPHPAHCSASASGVTWHRDGTRRPSTVELEGMPARLALRGARANGATVPESDTGWGGWQAPQHCLCSPLSFPRKESNTAASSPTWLLSTPNAASPKGDVLWE